MFTSSFHSFPQAYLAVSLASGRNYVVKEMKLTPGLSQVSLVVRCLSGLLKVGQEIVLQQKYFQTDRDRIFNEVNIIKSCFHANIIRYKEFFITGGDAGLFTISIVMEFAENGDLNQHIKHRKAKPNHYFPEVRIQIVSFNSLPLDLKTVNFFSILVKLTGKAFQIH